MNGIIVATNEYKVGDKNTYLETWGISTCIGIGILNKKLQKGYLGHFFSLDETEVQQVVDKALSEAEKPSDLEAVIAGNNCLEKETIEYLGEDYEKAMKITRKFSKTVRNYFKEKEVKIVEDRLHEESEDDGAYSIYIEPKNNILKVSFEEFL